MSPRQYALSGALGGALLIFALISTGIVHADVYQTDFGTEDTTSGNSWILQVGQGYTGTATAASVFAGASLPTSLSGPILEVRQFSDSGYTSETGNCFFEASLSPGVYATSTISVPRYATGDSGVGCVVNPTSYVEILIASDAAGSQYWRFYGSAITPSWITVSSAPGGGSVAVPYFYVSGVYGAQFGPNWTNISPNAPFTLGASSSAIAASSSLWASISIASSTLSCSTGNPFSDALCSAGAFLFVPSPSVLSQYAELPQTEQAHWPFSWLYQVQSTLSSATSTSGNLPAYSMDLYSAASTTFSSSTLPNFLPSFTFFSSSTIMTYLPSSDWSALQSLLAAVLWLGLVVDIFFVLRNRFHRV